MAQASGKRAARASKPRPSPFVIAFGCFEAFVDWVFEVPGKLDLRDMADVIGALRAWEADGTWEMAEKWQ